MALGPDYFLLFIVVGGLFIILTGIATYLGGFFEWIKIVCTPKPTPVDETEDVTSIGAPKTMRGRLRSSFALPRPIGPGFYTSSPFWTAPLPVALPIDMLSFDQAFPHPEWMSGYLFGLQSGLTANSAEVLEGNLNNFSNSPDPNEFQQAHYTSAQLNMGNPEFMVHLPGTLHCDGDHCAADGDGDHHVGMDFGDGGAGAAAGF